MFAYIQTLRVMRGNVNAPLIALYMRFEAIILHRLAPGMRNKHFHETEKYLLYIFLDHE